MTGELPSNIVAEISFIGRGAGQVKALAGFKKGHHTLPDAANAVTQAFLGKICEGELKAHAEKLYQAVRAGLGYRRTELSLQVASPRAILTAKDFDVEIFYELEADAPSRYATTTMLQHLKNAELARTEEFDGIFAAAFTELSFRLKKGASVEAMIDLIEGLGHGEGLTVNYPSDYRECRISVEGIDAQVRYSGTSLEMIFPRTGSPRELMEGFANVREAFAVSRELVEMIG
jgi:hypothetical protein